MARVTVEVRLPPYVAVIDADQDGGVLTVMRARAVAEELAKTHEDVRVYQHHTQPSLVAKWAPGVVVDTQLQRTKYNG